MRPKAFPLIFVSIVFLLECGSGGSVFLGSQVRFVSFFESLDLGLYASMAWLLARVYFLYLLFGLMLMGLEKGLAIRSTKDRALLYGGVSSYVGLQVFLMHPQIYDEFVPFTYPLRVISEFLTPNGLLVLALVWLVALAARSPAWRKVFVLLPLGLVLSHYFEFKRLERPPEPYAAALPSASPRAAPRNIIILSVDSMNSDFDQVLMKKLDPERRLLLTRLLEKSTIYEKAVTPVAQTHPSLISFLSGRIPPQHKVRNFLDPASLDTDELLKASPLSSLRDQGYRSALIRDTGDYEYFREGRVLERSLSPAQGALSFLLPFFLRHRLVFSLFNNPVGFLVLPEIRGDSQFTFGYKVQYFTEDVAKYLLSLGPGPSFTMAHTCAMHWPGSLQYPFYGKANASLDLAQYAYNSQWVRPLDFRLYYGPDRIRFHQQVYESGMRYVSYHFLEPLLRVLNDTGKLRDSVVVFMSDHGEDVNVGDDVLPRFRIPQHGSGLLFESVSDRPFFAIYDPSSSNGSRVTSPVSTASLLDVVAQLATGKREINGPRFNGPVYSESASLSRTQFLGQLILPKAFYANLFRVEPSTGDVSARADLAGAVLFQKQRAVYVGDARLTLYPTNYGFRVFLCHQRRDPGCRVNAVNSDRPLALRLLRSLLKIAESDFDQRFFKFKRPEASSDLSRLDFEFDLEGYLAQVGLTPEADWNALLVGLVRLHGEHKYVTADRIFRAVAEGQAVSPEARALADEQLATLCRAGVYDERWRPEKLAKLSPVQDSTFHSMIRADPTNGWGTCFNSIGNPAMAKWAEKVRLARWRQYSIGAGDPSLPTPYSGPRVSGLAVIKTATLAENYGLDEEKSAMYEADFEREGRLITISNASRLARQLGRETLSLSYLDALRSSLFASDSWAKTPAHLATLEVREHRAPESAIWQLERQALLSRLRDRVCAAGERPTVCLELDGMLKGVAREVRSL